MTIHKEGRSLILMTTLIVGLLLFATNHYFPQWPWLFWLVVLVGGFFWLAFVQFFRLPSRHNSASANQWVAPCDGKVVVIEEVEEPEYFKDKRIQVSIFMSPLNVHANWTPCAGEVKYAKYHPGKYLVAWHPKSSTENERTSIVVERADGKQVLFRQIAGALARRICNYSTVGQSFKQCDEYGFIKFGSRVDLLLPVGAKIHTKIGDVVKGGVTVLASW